MIGAREVPAFVGDGIEDGLLHVCAFKIALLDVDATEVRVKQPRVLEGGLVEIRPFELGPREVAGGHVGLTDGGALAGDALHRGAHERHVVEHLVVELGLRKVDAIHRRSLERGALDDRPHEGAAIELRPFDF